VGQQEALTREQAHFRYHLREYCSPAPLSTTVVVIIAVVARPTGIAVAAAIVVAGIVVAGVAAVFLASFAGDAKPVELDHWAVLPVPHHGGLNHFPEREGKSFSELFGIRIRMFLGLPDPLVTGMDPAPDPDPSLS
jgi:hypothetical protein